MPDADAIDVVAAVAEERDHGRAHVFCDRIVERELPVLCQQQDRGGGERLRHAGDPEAGTRIERFAGRPVGDAGRARPVQRRCRDGERHAGKARMSTRELPEELVEPCR